MAAATPRNGQQRVPFSSPLLRMILAAAIAMAAIILLEPGCSKTPESGGTTASGGAAATTRSLAGASVAVTVPDGLAIAGYVEAGAVEWSAKTGAKARVTRTPAAEILAALDSGKPVGDVLVYPPTWAGDTMAKGRLAPLREADLAALDWDDLLPAYRDKLSSWLGTPYGVPLDGELMFVYYRLDLFKDKDRQAKYLEKTGKKLAPPRTWADYAAVASFFSGEDFDGDGKPDSGAVEAGTGSFSHALAARAAAYGLRRNDPALFFESETMNASVAGPTFVQALEDLIEVQKSGAPGMSGFGPAEVRAEFLSGRAAMALDACDLATLTQQPADSKVKNQVGFTILPGSSRVYDDESSTWSDSKSINFAPYLADGGVLASVTASAASSEAAHDFLVHLGSKESTLTAAAKVGSPITPFRTWHMSRVSDWLKTGFSGDSARDYLGVVQGSLRHGNATLALRIPGADRYRAALERGCARALAGEAKPAEALEAVAAEWNKITDEIGRAGQRQAYRDSLGLPPD